MKIIKKLLVPALWLGACLLKAQTVTIPAYVNAVNHWSPDYYITYSSTPVDGPANYANVQTMVSNLGANLVRIGGNGYDEKGIKWQGITANDNDYIRVMKKVRDINPNAQFIIQMPFEGAQTFTWTAAHSGSLVTNIKAAFPTESFYYAVGNEWDFYAPNATYTLVSNIASTFTAHAQEIKKKDPTGKVLSPCGSSYYAPYSGTPYIMSLITPTTNANSICGFISGTGTSADGKPFCDIVDIHIYPGGQNGSMSNSTNSTQAISQSTYDIWRSDMVAYPQNGLNDVLKYGTNGPYTGIQKLISDAGRGSGTYSMTISLSEMNITTKNMTLTTQSSTNPLENTFEGIACRSFFAGQWWMDMYCSFLINSGGMAELVAPWSVWESSGDGRPSDLGMCRGTANSGTDPSEGGTYYHYEMFADNIRNCTGFLKGTTNTSIKAYGAFNNLNGSANDKYVVFAINQATTSATATVALNNTTPSGNYIKMNFPNGSSNQYALSMNANSTMVLVFNSTGVLLRKIEYKVSDGLSGKPTYTDYTLSSGNYIALTELGANQSACCGGVTLVSSPSIPSCTYTWYSSASNFVTALQTGTSNSYNVPTGSATYKCVVSYMGQTAFDYVKASVASGSGSCCRMKQIAGAPLDIDDDFYSYPNPTADNTTIKYSLPANVKYGKILISDVSGKIVKTLSVTSETETVDLDCKTITSGIYFYSLSVNDAILKTKKLIIVK